MTRKTKIEPEPEHPDPEDDEPPIRIEVQKIKRTTIEDLLNADLDTLSANFQTHAKKVLFDGNSHHGA